MELLRYVCYPLGPMGDLEDHFEAMGVCSEFLCLNELRLLNLCRSDWEGEPYLDEIAGFLAIEFTAGIQPNDYPQGLSIVDSFHPVIAKEICRQLFEETCPVVEETAPTPQAEFKPTESAHDSLNREGFARENLKCKLAFLLVGFMVGAGFVAWLIRK
ncbi:MAG: hypothetical protein ACRC8S_11325 [Fimbriiglobus sp.]